MVTLTQTIVRHRLTLTCGTLLGLMTSRQCIALILSRRLFKLQRPIRRIKSKENKNCHETQQHMKSTGPKTSHLKLNPPLGQTAVRCLPQNPNRFLSPKSVSRTPRSQHMIPQGEACHHQSIKALQDTPSIDKTSQGSCQLSMQETPG